MSILGQVIIHTVYLLALVIIKLVNWVILTNREWRDFTEFKRRSNNIRKMERDEVTVFPSHDIKGNHLLDNRFILQRGNLDSGD